MTTEPEPKQKKKFWQTDWFSYVLLLVSVSIVLVFFGVLIGQYAANYFGLGDEPELLADPVQTNDHVGEVDDQLSDLDEPVSVAELVPGSPVIYRVQVGAFSNRTNAETQLRALEELGYEGIIVPGPPYRVQTGAFASRDNAQRLAATLERQGIDVFIVEP